MAEDLVGVFDDVGVFDVMQQILLLLDVEDLLRCKSVCKSWHRLISTHSFVTSHLKLALKRDRQNHQLARRRFVCDLTSSEEECFFLNVIYIVGTYNGLLCLSPDDVDLVISNPSTRQNRKLPRPPYRPHWREGVCWGFGYDSCADDYKVIVGFRKYRKKETRFYVLTLKSNTWKFIGKVNYMYDDGRSGTLCGETLHWFMHDDVTNKTVVISLDLSTQKFKEIPQPQDAEYKYNNRRMRLGVIEECLCISSHDPYVTADNIQVMKTDKKWVLRNNKWELYTHHDHSPSKYDVVHSLIKRDHGWTSHGRIFADDGGTRVPSDGSYAPTSSYVKSLVSPHLHEKGHGDNKSHAKGNIRKRKRSCKHNFNKPFRLWNYLFLE